MPEAAMNKNHSAVFWQNYIRFSRKIFTVKTKTIAKGM